jgi:GR25 family glycosyltransferase involved in LPS biosynthesis
MNPLVSILCSTHNRQYLIPFIVHQFNKQDYPNDMMELIILDDSEKECFFSPTQNNIKYIYEPLKSNIGKKRNILNGLSQGEIIIWFDDDDFYTQNRVSNTVDSLCEQDVFMISGTYNMIMYDIIESKQCVNIQFQKATHVQNNVMAYKKLYLLNHKYNDDDNYNEEQFFTNNFTEPVMQFSCKDVCIHIAHKTNHSNKKLHLINKYRMNHFDIKEVMDDFSIKYLNTHLCSHTKKELTFHWINRDLDEDRRSYMNKQFENIGLQNKRFSAITTDSIKPFLINKRTEAKNTTIEELSCMCSHLEVMKCDLDDTTSSDDFIVIMEDDITLKSTILNLINIILNAPEKWEVLQLHHIKFEDYDYSKIISKWMPWKHRNFCTTFYVIKKTHAKKLVDMHIRSGQIRYDFGLCNNRIQADFNIYKDAKTYTLLNSLGCSNTSFTSNIQNKDWMKKKEAIDIFEKYQR